MTIAARTPHLGRIVGGAIAAVALLVSLTGSAPATSAPTAQMWDIVEVDGWEIRVRSIERRSDPLPMAASGGLVVRPEGQFALVVVDLTNRSSTPIAPTTTDFALSAASGNGVANVSDAPFVSTYAEANGFVPFGTVIAPDEPVMTVLIFDLDPRATSLVLSIGGGARRIRLDECRCSLPLPSEQIRQ